MTTFEIADSFDETPRIRIDWNAPLPLGHHAAVVRALELRNSGSFMSYKTIATVMAQYHGYRRSAGFWRSHLVAAGAERRPRGVPLTGTWAA